MSSDLIRWLLDLDIIPAGAEGVHLAWERPWPGWMWALLTVFAAVYAGWSYSRLDGRRRGRALLAVGRFLLIMLALALVSGPMLELPRETKEEDWVLVLLDRSASMTIADLQRADGRQTRDAQLRETLSAHRETWTALDEERRIVWLGFDRGAFDLAPADTDDVVTLEEPAGRRTRLSTSLEQAIQRAAARPLSGIVVFSDGRTSDPPTRALIRRLQADRVPVNVVPLGSDAAVGDLAIRRVDAPDRAFVRDKVPVRLELDQLGAEALARGATVKLIDEVTGEVLDTAEIDPSDPGADLMLTAKPMLAGEATWQVVIDVADEDLIPENNRRSFQIELIDRPLKVLYVDGYPRWEYRFVKDLIVLEESIESSVMLLSADRDFAQEGNLPITRLPRSPEEFAEYDVIIIGDVPGTFFSPDQLEMMRATVAERGAGLLWMGGERSTPNTYAGTALADLLPMRGSLSLPPLGEPVNIVPTELATRLGVLRLATNDEIGWPADLVSERQPWSRLRYVQRIEPSRLKPAAEPLAQTLQPIGDVQYPVVVHMRYGSGQTIYVATDEVWRWRFGRGSRLPEQFWLQMIRMLGRDRIVGGGSEPVLLTVTPHRLSTAQPMQIDLRLLDAQLAERGVDGVAAVIEDADGRVIADVDLQRLDGDTARFVATYLPEVSGVLTVRIVAPALRDLDLRTTVEVFQPDDELRRPETDHALLASLATETGGRVLAPDEIPLLTDPALSLLPNRSVRTETSITESIWDTPLVLMLVLVLLTAEWIGRKVMRLA